MGGVVVHHQVQLDRPAVLVDVIGVGAGDLFEEGQKLLVPERGHRAGDGAGGDLQGGEQRRGAVPEVVVGTA